jgi:hypothetical protein
MTGHCACGAVRVTITATPDYINDCNCGLCRKVGGAWSYFSCAFVSISGETRSFLRQDKANPAAEVHACSICSTTTHFVLGDAFKEQNPAVDLMGVNMRIFDPGDLAGVEVRFPDGSNWSGEGPFDYRRPALVIGKTSIW